MTHLNGHALRIDCLHPDYCRRRQERLREHLREVEVDCGLLFNRRHVHYFTGYWHYSPHSAVAVIIPAAGPVVLIAPGTPQCSAVDHCLPYQASQLGTLVDDQLGALLLVARPMLKGVVGVDELSRPWLLGEVTDLNPALLALRRAKDADEVGLIQRAIACCDAAYRVARTLQPGMSEVQLYASLLAAATEEAGEPIGEFGNDFQSGTPGGLPRPRAIEAGEMAIYDLTAIYRGYCCDLCRSFAVGGTPSPAQCEAYRLIMEALAHIESTVRPGKSCRELYQEVHAMLDGKEGWRFPHHLGHGISLSPHEAPHLNPHWNDVFQPGDVFTAEPGLYSEELRGGIRIEQNYLVTATGILKLSHFPTEMKP